MDFVLEALPQDPQAVAQLLWWLTLAIGLVVALVVTGLLAWIHHEARVIRDGVSEIWNVGQRVANNTVHIPSLYRTNALAARILGAAGKIHDSATAIARHADSCPGCPQCLARRGGAGG